MNKKIPDRRLILFVVIILFILIADQWTKILIRNHFTLPVRNPIYVIGENLIITRVENRGVAFGIHFPGIHIISYIGFLMVIAYLLFQYRKEKPFWLNDLAFSLIIGGAVGNFIDRLFRGTVTDMVQMGVAGYYWPVYNVADAAISVGVVLFFIGTLILDRQKKNVD